MFSDDELRAIARHLSAPDYDFEDVLGVTIRPIERPRSCSGYQELVDREARRFVSHDKLKSIYTTHFKAKHV